MSARKIVIETPQGFIAQRRIKTGRITATLSWNPGFGPRLTENLNRSQAFVDNEVLRKSEPYTPLRTGTLVKTGILGTIVGSGLVQWIAPYARAQYYSKRAPGSAFGPQRGPRWFERMKNDHGRQIIAGARKIGGGGGR